jgi:hypothetical protein
VFQLPTLCRTQADLDSFFAARDGDDDRNARLLAKKTCIIAPGGMTFFAVKDGDYALVTLVDPDKGAPDAALAGEWWARVSDLTTTVQNVKRVR